MKSDCRLLHYELSDYRRSFLKRKNINHWKKNIDGTPESLDKLLNSFNRKIKSIPLFTDDVKVQYFEGLNKIFEKHYEELKFNNASRKDAYYKYCGQNFKTTGNGRAKKNNLNELMTFKQFVSAGLSNNYRYRGNTRRDS